jgi:spermidine synthase
MSVALLFVGSGCAALIYELVWFHLLRLVIGSSSISLGIVLASFMGGMCLGSWALARIVPARFHPLRVYAALELAIGAFGASLPWWLPWLSGWYFSIASESLTGITARAIVAAFAVLPATFLMGATLPAVARWVKSTPDGLAQLGVFYGANIIGAVFGCLLAGFVLLPWTDVVMTSYVAAAINVVVAIVAWQLARTSEYLPVPVESNATTGGQHTLHGFVCFLAGLSGFAALSAEVIWTRLLTLLFGSTVYTFAIILAVFLAGLGLGSVAAAYWVRRTRRPLLSLAVAQLAIVCLMPYASYVITQVVPHWERPAVFATNDVYGVFLHDSKRAALALLPSAFFWGASFPLALAAAGSVKSDTGRLVGQVYAANTLGAIAGALATSSLLIPWIGTRHSQQLIAVTAGAAATLAWFMVGRTPKTDRSLGESHLELPNQQRAIGIGSRLRLVGSFALIAITVVSAISIAEPPHGFFGWSQRPGLWSKFTIEFQKEGRSTTVVVQSAPETPYRYISVGGRVEASNLPIDLRCQRLLGHLAALIHPDPKKTLTVGMGTGSTAGCFVLYPNIEENVICEIEPVVREAAGGFFAEVNNGVIDNERTTIHFDDARHFLATTHESFDIITADPIEPWRRGTAALYSAEYFELCKKRLNPGGIVVQWMSLYEKDERTAKCELASFLDAFPDALFFTSWAKSDGADQNHDIIALGQLSPAPLDLAEIDRRIRENPELQASLAEVDLATIPELIGQYAGSGKDLQPWLADAEINRDRSLRLEYLAGLAVFRDRSHALYEKIAEYRRYPAELLENDAAYEAEIRERLKPPE